MFWVGRVEFGLFGYGKSRDRIVEVAAARGPPRKRQIRISVERNGAVVEADRRRLMRVLFVFDYVR